MDSLRYPSYGFKNEVYVGDISFSPNGTDDPDYAYTTGTLSGYLTLSGGNVYVKHESTVGLYTLQFTNRFIFPDTVHFIVGATCDTSVTTGSGATLKFSNVFNVCKAGKYDTATRKLQVQTYKIAMPASTTERTVCEYIPVDVPSSTGKAKVNIAVFARNSQGK